MLLPIVSEPDEKKAAQIARPLTKSTNLVETTHKDYQNLIMSSKTISNILLRHTFYRQVTSKHKKPALFKKSGLNTLPTRLLCLMGWL